MEELSRLRCYKAKVLNKEFLKINTCCVVSAGAIASANASRR